MVHVILPPQAQLRQIVFVLVLNLNFYGSIDIYLIYGYQSCHILIVNQGWREL